VVSAKIMPDCNLLIFNNSDDEPHYTIVVYYKIVSITYDKLGTQHNENNAEGTKGGLRESRSESEPQDQDVWQQRSIHRQSVPSAYGGFSVICCNAMLMPYERSRHYSVSRHLAFFMNDINVS